jgi:hypothetical protein
MNRPPYLMRVHIDQPDSKKINLWIPLFIVLPFIAIILLPFVLILAPFVLIAAIVLWPWGWGKPLLIAAPLVLTCLYALRGLEVNISNSHEKVNIAVK